MQRNKANLRDLIAATGLVILLKLDWNRRFFSLCDLEIWWMTSINYGAPLLHYIKICASFQIHWWIQTGVTVRKRLIWVKIGNILSRVTLKFHGWPRKTIGHLFYATLTFVHHLKAIGEFKLKLQTTVQKRSIRVKISDFVPCDLGIWWMIGHLFYGTLSFVHHFIAIGEFKLKLQSGNAQFGSKSAIYCPLWPWNLTDDLENNRAPLLSNIKLYASFHRNMWIQTGVTFRKRLNGIMTSVTLTFDLDLSQGHYFCHW